MDNVPLGSLLTSIMLVATVIWSAVWDVYAMIRYGPEATITHVIGNWSAVYPVLPLTVGLVLGHLFWPRVR
jgi:hypothetical protein